MKILIADENRLEADGLRHVLERADDIDVVGATHQGNQICGLIERRRPDVVALDLDMHDGENDWLDVVHREHPEVKLVVVVEAAHPLGAHARGGRIRPADGQSRRHPLHAASGLRRHGHHRRGGGRRPRGRPAVERPGPPGRSRMLKALTRGLPNKAISEGLWVSEETVKFHLGNLYRNSAWQTGPPRRHSHTPTASPERLLPGEAGRLPPRQPPGYGDRAR